jgi:hypothetical protein
MRLTIASSQPAASNAYARKQAARSSHAANHFAVDEINAYIAARDGLLEEAGPSPTLEDIKRLTLANDFVANCLRPVRNPYILQSLPEVDAVRELQRCHVILARIRKLQAALVAAA